MIERVSEAPEYLRDKIADLFSVRRFEGYAEGIINDNTGAHTIGGLDIIEQLPINNELKQAIKAYFWIHDLTEIVTGDYDIVKRQDQHLRSKIKGQEKVAAKTLLSEKDQQRLEEFNAAKELLKGKPSKIPTTPEAIIAALVDKIEGNITFHTQLAAWVNSEHYSPQNLPEEFALTYTFVVQNSAKKNLPSCNLGDEHQRAADYLLEFQMSEVVEAWESVPTDRVPPSVAEGLKLFKLVDTKRS